VQEPEVFQELVVRSSDSPSSERDKLLSRRGMRYKEGRSTSIERACSRLRWLRRTFIPDEELEETNLSPEEEEELEEGSDRSSEGR